MCLSIVLSACAFAKLHSESRCTILLLLLLLWFKAGAPRAEHYQLVRTLSADAVVTVL